jgi:hypothetical protein
VVVFDTGHRLATAAELAAFLPRMSTGSIFYHFIEARRRPPLQVDDFSAWLEQWGEETALLRRRLAEVDYYFWTLRELRDRLSAVFQGFVKEEGSDDCSLA